MTDDNLHYFAHDTACVDEGAVIGSGTRIWHFSHIMPDCVIGKDCNFGQNVVVSPSCTIGNNVKVQNNVSIYSGVVLEDDVFCGPSMVFTNVINPRSHVSRKDEYQKTLVKQGASIGANATIVCGNTIGQYSFVGAGCVVISDVPDYGLVVGNPSRMIGYVCYCGEGLDLPFLDVDANVDTHAGASLSTCGACSRQYEMFGHTVRELKSAADKS